MKKQHLKLSKEDFEHLEGLLAKGSLKARVFKRATGLLELHRGKSYKDVATSLGVNHQVPSVWASRYKTEGLQMLMDKPRSGRPIEISGEERAKITALACSKAPEGHSTWTLRLLADKAVELGYCEHLSHNHVRAILKKTNSSPT